jgi:hypothetical protein
LKKLKKALEPDADEVLIFQDEVEIHLHPSLARQRAPVGQQPQVPTPGKNEKKIVYGGVDYRTGVLTYTVAATKCGAEFLAFLILLVKNVCRPEDSFGVRQWPLPSHEGGASVAGRTHERDRSLLVAAMQPQSEFD